MARLFIVILCMAGFACMGCFLTAPTTISEKGLVSPVLGNELLNVFNDAKIRLVIRVDDIGFTHAANMAMKQLAEEGCVTAASVLVNTPWLDEGVEILKANPEVTVGVHTCFNCEWSNYRWGPVSCPGEVRSLVDQWGKFFGSRKQLMEHQPDLDEFELELRAQIDLVIAKGLNPCYIDHHMSAAVETPEMKARFVKVANEYGLGISRWFGEQLLEGIYNIDPSEKTSVLLEQLRAINKPGLYLLVCHPGLNHPELAVLKDVHPWAPKNMSVHRQAETETLCDPRLRKVLREKQIELVGYDILREKYLDRMTEPIK